MSFDIKIEKGTQGYDIIPDAKVSVIKHRIKDILDDIADSVEYQASIFAPISDEDDKEGGSAFAIPSGTLAEHPVDITETGFGKVANFANEAEGFRSIRGEGGRFVKGKGTGVGHIFYTTTITYPEQPFYAKYVAFGTGIYGPEKRLIVTGREMKFRYLGKRWRLKSVKGQKPQPYLDEATDKVNSTYIPIKMRELRAQVDAIT